MTQANQVVEIEDNDWDETPASGTQLVANTNETQQVPKKASRRAKRDWTGHDVLRVHLRPKLHDELNARVALNRSAQSDVIEAALLSYLKVQPKVDEQMGTLLKMVLPHDLFTSADALRSAARTSWIETIKGALAKATQPDAQKPKLGAPRPDATTIVTTPRVTEGFGGLVSVTDHR
jgi:hypothetical protein